MLTARARGALFGLAGALLLLLPSAASAKVLAFDPTEEFIVHPWFHLNVGPIDLGISKAVVYLWLAAAITILVTLWIVRGGLKQQPGRLQILVELLYTFSESNIGQATLPKAHFKRWFPYVASLFLFIWVLNIISFLPLPFDTHNKVLGIPTLTLYAATSSISVTLALALLSIIISHVEGVRANGVGPYLASWIPPAPGVLKPLVGAIEVLSQFLRIVSLSVRLFANMFAGHLLIIMCIGFSIVVENYIGLVAIPVGVAFYLFEWVLIASLQAYIFAMLSGIYIGGAIEPAH